MMQIFTQTPIYVWPLFAYLFFIGIKARKTNIVPIKMLLIMPTVFSIWSFYSVVMRYGTNPLNLSLWALSLILGIFVGFLITRRLSMRFDKTTKRVEMPGSWIPLILFMFIFSTKYFLGVTYSLHPELIGSASLLLLECVATMIPGIFTGRFVACLQKYKASSHVNLI